MRILHIATLLLVLSMYANAQSNCIPSSPEPPDSLKVQSEEIITFISYPEAQFPGGYVELIQFMEETIQYPEEALKDTIEGKVYVQFYVEVDGSLTDIAIARGIHPLLDQEALRVISLMPNWIPGRNENGPSRELVRFPIVFHID